MGKTIQIGSGAKTVPTSTTNSSGVTVSRTPAPASGKASTPCIPCGRK